MCLWFARDRRRCINSFRSIDWLKDTRAQSHCRCTLREPNSIKRRWYTPETGARRRWRHQSDVTRQLETSLRAHWSSRTAAAAARRPGAGRPTGRYRARRIRLHTAIMHWLPTVNGHEMQTGFRQQRDTESNCRKTTARAVYKPYQRCTTDRCNVTTFQIRTLTAVLVFFAHRQNGWRYVDQIW